MNACISTFRVFVLVLFWLTNAPVPTDAQAIRVDLLLPDTPDYASLSENGKALFNGLTRYGRYGGETVIVRMRPIAEVLSNNRLQITILGRAEQFDVHVKNIEYSDAANYKLYGTVGESLLSVLLTSRNGMKGGLIQGPTRSYEICDLGDDGQLLLTHEDGNVSRDFCATDVGSRTLVPSEPDQAKHGRMPGDNAKIEPCTSGIRVLFLYGNNVSPVSATNHAYNTIDVFNQAVTNSGVPGTALLELAGVAQTTYQPTTGIIVDEALNLSNNANAQTLRNQYNADVVVYLSWHDYNGLGGVPNPSVYLHPINARAFAVVSLQGSNIPLIAAHELSHLFGCNHENDNFGLPYSKGFVFSAYNTLVARGVAPGSKILYYSNPNKSYNGSTMGDVTHNNAKVMTDKASTVKAFRAEPNVLNGWIYGPYSGYEYQVYTYEAIARCGNPPYSYLWQESSDGINYSGNATGEFHNVGLYHNGNHLFYLKLKITSSDAQVVETWMQIWVDDEPNGGYRIGAKGMDSSDANGNMLMIRPNPVSDRFEIVFNTDSVSEADVNLTDQTGRVVFRRNHIPCKGGLNTIKLDLAESRLQPGSYIVTLRCRRQLLRKKIIYQPSAKQ